MFAASRGDGLALDDSRRMQMLGAVGHRCCGLMGLLCSRFIGSDRVLQLGGIARQV